MHIFIHPNGIFNVDLFCQSQMFNSQEQISYAYPLAIYKETVQPGSHFIWIIA